MGYSVRHQTPPRLSTAVVSPPDMYQEILAITSELRTEGLELLMEESQEIFEMEASYILFANMTLAIYVHLPVGKLGSSMKLYQFVPTPFRFENRSELFMVEPPRQLLASSPNVELVQVELSALDFELCDHIRSTYYCPARTRWTYDTRQSCLTALYRRDALVVNEKCPISAIPYEDMSVQLDEKTFILAVDGDEVFRFMCNEKLVSSMRLSGLLRLEIPKGCYVMGEWMKLVPSYDLFYNSGRIRVVKVDPLEDINGTAKEWAVNTGLLAAGEKGQSVGGIEDNWEDHKVKEKKRSTFVNLVMTCLWGLLCLIVTVAIIFLCTKLFALWMLKKRIGRAMKLVRNVVGDNEATSGRVSEALAHVQRLSQMVRQRAGFGDPADPGPEDGFEEVQLGDLSGVPAPTQP